MNLRIAIFSVRFTAGIVLATLAFFCPLAQGQVQFHGAAILKTPVGPDGVTPNARVGDTVRATITVMNMDDFGDTITITNIFDIVHHASGDAISPNLLTAPVTLSSPIFVGGISSVDVSYTYQVLPGDANLPFGILPDDARAEGTDNHDGPGGTHLTQPFFLTYPGQIMATTNAVGCPGPTNCALGAVSDPTYRPAGKPPGRNQALWMKGISTNLIFSPDPGSWVENSDGTARLTGTLRSLTNTTSGFTIVLNLSGRTTTVLSGSPKLDLDPSAYVANGGPLDPATWYYYANATGTLTGFGFWQGAALKLVPAGPAFQVGVGANGKNLNYGGSAWFNWTITHQPTSGSLPTTGQADLNVDFICCP